MAKTYVCKFDRKFRISFSKECLQSVICKKASSPQQVNEQGYKHILLKNNITNEIWLFILTRNQSKSR